MVEFREFKKIPRLSRNCVITEKIDGTNGVIYIGEDGEFLTGSRTRWITPEQDNYGFSRWAHENKEELMKLGVGLHYGEWWGQGIQRRYSVALKRFSLFNSARWTDNPDKPSCCFVVPVLYIGVFDIAEVDRQILSLKEKGSVASPGFMNPEGVVVYHTAGRMYFKKTIEKDEEFKGNK